MDDSAPFADWIGARIDTALANVDTGLIALRARGHEARVLGVGIGPRVAGVGWLASLPHTTTPAAHPLVAALRAHLADHRVRAVRVSDGVLWIEAGGATVFARVGFVPTLHGSATVLDSVGREVIHWPAREGDATETWQLASDLVAAGEALLRTSDTAELERLRTAVMRALEGRVRVLERRDAAVRVDLERAAEVPKLQKLGRLLAAQCSRIPRGAREALLDDWDDGGTLTLVLDPAKSARTQADEYFARARRLQRGTPVMQHRLAETETQLIRTREWVRRVRAATDFESLEHATADVREARVGVTASPAAATRRSKSEARLPYHRFFDAARHPILVGRGGADNDALTLHHARPHDLWLHAKGISGAHVVVPLDKSASCPADLLVDAATLAAHFSDARSEGVVDVSYVARRYVRKPKGSAPGAVTHDREKVIAVRMEPERLRRLLDSRDA